MGIAPNPRWQEIDRIFEGALERPQWERDAFVESACAGDRELARAVHDLLEASEEASEFLEEPVLSLSPEVWHQLTGEDEPEQERIGAYRILRRLGRGGMGTVYLAERADGAFEQKVAIKLLRRGLDTDDVLERFRAERQILASLSHPHIAHLLDGGSTASGLPYLVMEYVEGEPITTYCDRNRLGIEARLRLFASVCRSVHYAHQSLVLHRDLKPSNILVAPAGRPKLLDFGIAKVLSPAGAGTGARTEARLLTPEFASPEQLRGDYVTTAADIYQLGLLLYLLLVGCPPLHERRSGIRRHLPHTYDPEPSPPSTFLRRGANDVDARARARGSTPERLQRRIRGDLDAIVLRATRWEPEQRYASAEQLAEDIERHLAGMPVLARGGAWRYRTGRVLRRHWGKVLSSAVVTASLIALSGVAVHQSRQAARERDAAQREAVKAAQVSEFLVGLFESLDPSRSAGPVRSPDQVLDQGIALAVKELGSQPDLQAEILSTAGRIYQELGDDVRARQTAREALQLRRETLGDEHPAVAESLHQMGELLLYTSRDSARAFFAEALRHAERSHGAGHPFVAEVLVDYGRTFPVAEGLPFHDQALSLLRSSAGDVRDQLATALTETFPPDEDTRIRRLQEALQLRRAVSGRESLGYAEVLNDLGLALAESDPPAADRAMGEAIDTYTRLVGEAHPTRLTLVNNFAGVLRDRGDLAGAERLYREVLAVRRGQTHPVYRYNLGYTLYGLGRVLVEQGQGEEGEPLLREALEIFPKAEDIRNRLIRLSLGRALMQQGRYSRAEAVLREVHADVRRHEGVEAAGGEPLRLLIQLMTSTGRAEEAARLRSDRE